MNRRQVLSVMIGGATVGFAGCSDVVGPDPRVVDAEVDAGIIDTLTGQAEIDVTVVNEGSAGDVVVYVEIYDTQDTLLDRFGKEIFMKKDERRRVKIRINVDDDAEYYEAHAEAI